MKKNEIKLQLGFSGTRTHVAIEKLDQWATKLLAQHLERVLQFKGEVEDNIMCPNTIFKAIAKSLLPHCKQGGVVLWLYNDHKFVGYISQDKVKYFHAHKAESCNGNKPEHEGFQKNLFVTYDHAGINDDPLFCPVCNVWVPKEEFATHSI